MELLKQPQSTPYAMEDQVSSIWMGTNGYLDDIEVSDVLRFERGLLDHLHANSTVLDTIAATGDLTKDTEEALKNAVEEFHRQWLSAGRGVSDLEEGEVSAERTREEISRGRTNEKA
jgi:ATP synthase subunit alpha